MKNNIELENEIMAIINYFKLIYVLELTKDKKLDTFIMLKGKSMLDKLSVDEGKYILFEDDNMSLLKKLYTGIEEATSINHSMSPFLKLELDNIGWINEITIINPKEKYYNTICNNSGNEIINLVLNYRFASLASSNNMVCKRYIKEIIKR